MTAMRATATDSPVGQNIISPVIQKSAVIDGNIAQPGVTLATRIEKVVGIVAESRARRLREAGASDAFDAEPTRVQP